eukprot:g5045.t1
MSLVDGMAESGASIEAYVDSLERLLEEKERSTDSVRDQLIDFKARLAVADDDSEALSVVDSEAGDGAGPVRSHG